MKCCKFFISLPQDKEAAKKLLLLHEGKDRASDYTISFRTLATECGWNETALVTTFLNGLSESMKSLNV